MKKTILFTVLVISIFFILVLITHRKDSALRYKTSNLDTAKEIFKAKVNNLSSLNYFKTGLRYNNSRMFYQAIPYFRKAIELNPDFGRAYFELGFAYQFTDQKDLAIENYEKGIALDPNFTPVYVQLSVLFLEKGDGEKKL